MPRPFTVDDLTLLMRRVKGGAIEGSVDLKKYDLEVLPDLSGVEVTGDFYCYDNQLTSLAGSPAKVGRDFFCGNNRLASLRGGPRTVGRNYWASFNPLTSLYGSPVRVGNLFWATNCRLRSLEYLPAFIGSTERSDGLVASDIAQLGDNPGHFTTEQIVVAYANAQRSAGGLGEAVQSLLRP